MSDDEAKTPKQSGSFGIMTGICHDSILELSRWLTTAPDSAEKKIVRLIQEFRTCSSKVQAWTITTEQTEKKATVAEIFALREAALKHAELYGYKLR